MLIIGMKRQMIYKLFKKNEWETLKEDTETSGAPIDIKDGYIHFSTEKQLKETAKKYFTGVEDLFLAAIDETKLGKDLFWEPARNNDLFPHLYRKLKLSEIVWCKRLFLKNDLHIFPDNLS